MKVSVKSVSASGFALALVCFLFPWVSVSCPGQSGQFLRLTGVQLAVGASVEEPTMFGKSSKRKIPGEPLALGALACSVVGLVVSMAKSRGSKIVAAAAGTTGVVLLLLLKSKVEGDLAREGQGMLEAHWEPGFWIAFVALVGAFLVNFLVWRSTVSGRDEAT